MSHSVTPFGTHGLSKITPEPLPGTAGQMLNDSFTAIEAALSSGISGYSGYSGAPSCAETYYLTINEGSLAGTYRLDRKSNTSWATSSGTYIVVYRNNGGSWQIDIDPSGNVTSFISDTFPLCPPVGVNDGTTWEETGDNNGIFTIYFGNSFVGTSGFSGYSGLSGFSGYSGSGFSGYSGASGFSGYSGRSGFSGYSGAGASGFSGYSGPSGFSGYSGPSGFSGYSGKSGFSGYSGPSGFSGYSGPSGFSGYSGSGFSGYSGATGAGTSGFSGYSGPSGFSGYSGPSGFSGYSGKSGFSGYSGANNTSGFSGYSGPSGFSGYSGRSGYSGYSGSGFSGYSGLVSANFPLTGTTVDDQSTVELLGPTGQRVSLPASGCYWFELRIQVYDQTDDGVDVYYSNNTVMRNSTGTCSVTYHDFGQLGSGAFSNGVTDFSNITFGVSVDDTAKQLVITVIGLADTTIKWSVMRLGTQ